MRKTTKTLVMLLTVVMMLGAFSTTAFAATNNSSAVMKRSTKDTQALVNAGEYYGWSAEVKTKSQTPSTIVTSIRLFNGKNYIFNVTQTTQKKGSSIATKYNIGGKNYVLAGIKASLKRYASGAGKRAVLEDKVNIAADTLAKYARKMGWTVTDKTSYKSGVATCKHIYQNGKYKFTAVVKGVRKSGKIALSYTRDGRSSNKKAVKAWLKTYATN